MIKLGNLACKQTGRGDYSVWICQLESVDKVICVLIE